MTAIRRIADDVIEIAAPSAAIANALADQLRASPVGGLAEEVVAGFESVCVSAPPYQIENIIALLSAMELDAAPPRARAETIDVPVVYGGAAGPDLQTVCDQIGMTPRALIDLHTTCVHTVELVGFTPGFTYISGLPASFAIPRLQTPRPRVVAGSIGISGASTGIYAMAGPGGWPLIGQTQLVLFDPDAAPPFRLRPGMGVRFVPVEGGH